MLGYIEIVFIIFSVKARRGLQRPNLRLAKLSVVLACTGLTPRNVSQL